MGLGLNTERVCISEKFEDCTSPSPFTFCVHCKDIDKSKSSNIEECGLSTESRNGNYTLSDAAYLITTV